MAQMKIDCWYVNKLQSVKDKVRAVYDTWPLTVQSDRLLVLQYLKLYHNIIPSMAFRHVSQRLLECRISLESITRAGRWWRANYPEVYDRKDIATEAEESYKEVFKHER